MIVKRAAIYKKLKLRTTVDKGKTIHEYVAQGPWW